MYKIGKLIDANIPEPGSSVTKDEILNLCENVGKWILYSKVVLYPKTVMHFDGCTSWLQYYEEKPIYKACFFHDVAYWMGGSKTDRLIADANLMIDIAILTKDVGFAELMFSGVRWLGKSVWRKRKWGFGHKV